MIITAQNYFGATGIDPGNDLANLNLAHVIEVRGEKSEAERLLIDTLVYRPNDPRLFSTLGQVQMSLSLTAGQAKMKARMNPDPKAEKQQPPSPTELLDHVDKALMSRAEYNAKRAIELHPRYLKAYLDLGLVLRGEIKIQNINSLVFS